MKFGLVERRKKDRPKKGERETPVRYCNMQKEGTSQQLRALLTDLLHFQVQLKQYHWATTSFARHKASDSLHDAMQDLTDRLAEASIGRLGRDKVLSTKRSVADDAACDAHLITMRDRLQKIKLAADAPDLMAIRDEMVEKINQTLYFFTQS